MCPGLTLFRSAVPQFISLRSEVLLRSLTSTSIPLHQSSSSWVQA